MVCRRPKAREKGAGHADYRRGLSPERPVDRVGRHRNGRVCGTATEPQGGRSREVLPGTGEARSERTSGDGGHRLLTLVRAVIDRVGYRVVDWGCPGDRDQTSPPAEERSQRCQTSVEAAPGRELSPYLG